MDRQVINCHQQKSVLPSGIPKCRCLDLSPRCSGWVTSGGPGVVMDRAQPDILISSFLFSTRRGWAVMVPEGMTTVEELTRGE